MKHEVQYVFKILFLSIKHLQGQDFQIVYACAFISYIRNNLNLVASTVVSFSCRNRDDKKTTMNSQCYQPYTLCYQ